MWYSKFNSLPLTTRNNLRKQKFVLIEVVTFASDINHEHLFTDSKFIKDTKLILVHMHGFMQ